MPRTYIIANWKMNMLAEEARSFATTLLAQELPTQVTAVLCPPYTLLATLKQALEGSDVRLGAQNCAYAPSGAFTGEISPAMLKDAGCHMVILGHSERRSLFHEEDATIASKVALALSEKLQVVLCIGETLEQREEGKVAEVLCSQLQQGLPQGVQFTSDQVVLAYEPVWAIGTGRSAQSAEITEVVGIIRNEISRIYDSTIAADISILYGGSVNTSNVSTLSATGANGALVGGASLNPLSFAGLVAGYESAEVNEHE